MDHVAAAEVKTVTCVLCKREYPRSHSSPIGGGRYVCGPPRFCWQYANTSAACQ